MTINIRQTMIEFDVRKGRPLPHPTKPVPPKADDDDKELRKMGFKQNDLEFRDEYALCRNSDNQVLVVAEDGRAMVVVGSGREIV